MKRIISFCLSVLLLFGCVGVPVAAVNTEIMPYYNNILSTYSNFTIDSSGKGTVEASYRGYINVTDSITVTIKIQKRSLGLIWTKVDIGTENNEIIVTSTNTNDDFIYDVQLKSTGNYRAVITYTVSGSGGADDTIEDICTAEYN